MFCQGRWFLVDAARLEEERKGHAALLRSEAARLTEELSRLGGKRSCFSVRWRAAAWVFS